MEDNLDQTLRDYGLEYFGRFYSCYRGNVIDNRDPDNRGRLKVNVPQIHADDTPDTWCESKGMPAGANSGLFIVPAIGDLVWITFECGDPSHPIWEYGHYRDKKSAPEMARRAKPDNYVFQSPKGQRIELDDQSQSITITGVNDNVIKLHKDGRVTIENKAENLKDIISDLMTEIISLDIMTPAGPGFVGPASLTKILEMQIRLLKLLK